MHLHRRQFVIGPRQYLIDKSWQAFPLNASTWLSCCPDLPVTQAKDASGNSWYVLGLAVETRPDIDSPAHGIALTEPDQIPNLYANWAGRWILVGNGQLHLDASGLLGCFYGKNSQGEAWASSSAALLAQTLWPNSAPSIDPRRLVYTVGISWYTPPRSRFEGISRLLPSQGLELESGSVKPRALMPDICPTRDYETVLEQIQQILISTLQKLSKLSPDLWLGLTAGYDSRLMLALSYIADIPVRPFTRVAARMSVADRVLPPKLAKACGYDHSFIRNRQRHPNRKQLAAEQTARHVSEGDAEPFIQGVRDHLAGISFGGHGFAVASRFSKLHTLPEQVTSVAEGAKQLAQLFQEPIDSTATLGLEGWLTWAIEHPQDNLDWRDRFFIEQRQAGWLSSKEQLYDLTDLVRFPILNSAYLYALLLSVREDQRVDSKIQEDLLERLHPELAAYPFNPKDSDFHLFQILIAKGRDFPQYALKKLAQRVG